MAEEHNGLSIPRIEELANGHEPFITATKAARLYKVNYWQLVLAARLGQIEGLEFLQKERGKGLAMLIPISQAKAWAEKRHVVTDARAVKRAEKQALKDAKAQRVAETSKELKQRRAEHMARMRRAKELKRAGYVPAPGVLLPEGEQAVEDSLKNLSKREVYAILTALERLAQVHAERAAKDEK